MEGQAFAKSEAHQADINNNNTVTAQKALYFSKFNRPKHHHHYLKQRLSYIKRNY